ncbi:MAG: isopentenyl-diphosphate Delta-isomerase [Bacteroidota bacterium]|nr:isopentenyl-diphosphate Delta-isomerase [Bacteroidota bacterium]MDP4225431.1 isopentenyl-diphosphate Delta-isomerase [Bacteroidota bacterium]MDP4273477.1 isopentenyl-diphosphate Delta-isomerase [Bacteroidota bacterium]
MMGNVILVDEYDTPLGEIAKLEAHQKALLHRAVSVFVFNNHNKILLQKRAAGKYHSPDLWTNTACTHPFPNESNEAAVIRRLKEEMGITINYVTKIFHFIYKEQLENGLTEYEFDHVFVGFSDELPIPDSDEVSDFDYVDIKEVLEQVKMLPQNYTVWFKKIIERVANEVSMDNNIKKYETPMIVQKHKQA